MTEERLMQYRGLIQEIVQLGDRLAKLKSKGPHEVSDTVTTAAEFPFSKHTKAIHGIAVDDYTQKEQRILEKQSRALRKAQVELEILEEYISTVQDATIRTIMRYRYVEGWGWLRIATKFGWRDETTPHKKIQDYLSNSGFSGKANVE